MRRGKLLAMRRVAVVATLSFSMCTAGQAVSPPSTTAAEPTTSYATRVSVGWGHACAIVAGKVYCWGVGTNYELGTSSNADATQAVEARAFTDLATAPAKITAGYDYTCALNTASLPYCWGRNNSGVLGNGTQIQSEKPELVSGSPPRTFSQLSASDTGAHTCAVDTNTPGTAWCWGSAQDGRLGNPSPPANPLCPTPTYCPVAVATSAPSELPATADVTRIAAGGSHTCALASGRAYCWGANGSGQLGCGPTCGGSSGVPLAVVATASTPLSGKTLTEITAGYDHTCALDDTGAAYCWGSNSDGQLGNDAASGGSSTQPVPVYGSDKWIQITAGTRFTCAINTAGKAYCWGAGYQGQLGVSSPAMSIRPIPVSTSTSLPPAVGSSWLPDTAVLTQIDSGDAATCVMDTMSNVYCWGARGLGNGSPVYSSSYVPVKVEGLPPPSPLVPPSPPTNVSATPGNTTATISWTASTITPPPTVTGYTATATFDGQSFTCSTPIPSTPVPTTCEITGLTNGRTYQVTVVAHSSAGVDSDPSHPPVPVTPVGVLSITCPATPQSLGSTTPGGTVSGQLGTFTVTDTRGVALGAGQWTVTVVLTTPFTHTVTPAFTIPAGNVTYSIEPFTTNFTDAEPIRLSGADIARPGGATLIGTVPVLRSGTATGGTAAASWNPWISAVVPSTAVAGNYTATLSTSVIAGTTP